MEIAISVASILVAILGLWFVWRQARNAELRQEDVLVWSKEVIRVLETLEKLLILCVQKEPIVSAEKAKEKLTEFLFETSVLVEQGRLFFKNAIVGDHGQEKERAYRGYRPKILDPIVVASEITNRWFTADEEMKLRLCLIAEDYRRKFVSLAQQEIGRSRTVSAETRRGGDGIDLDLLMQEVDKQRLENFRRNRQ